MSKPLRQIRVEGNIAYVPLTRGYEALIDAADVPLVEGRKWHVIPCEHTIYAATNIITADGRRTVKSMHRILMSPPDDLCVDHADGNGLNNRRNNLRFATPVQNMYNKRLYANNRTGLKGVRSQLPSGRWIAYIGIGGGQQRSVGTYDTKEEAYAAYCAAAVAQYGEFARFK